MLNYRRLHEVLSIAANRHDALHAKFLEFSRHVKDQLTSEGFPIRGIKIALAKDFEGFDISFAGRKIRFVFSFNSTGASGMQGVVSCYAVHSIPEEKLVMVGQFLFNGRGMSDIVDPEEEENLNIDYDLSATYIALHFINESLSK